MNDAVAANAYWLQGCRLPLAALEAVMRLRLMLRASAQQPAALNGMSQPCGTAEAHHPLVRDARPLGMWAAAPQVHIPAATKRGAGD